MLAEHALRLSVVLGKGSIMAIAIAFVAATRVHAAALPACEKLAINLGFLSQEQSALANDRRHAAALGQEWYSGGAEAYGRIEDDVTRRSLELLVQALGGSWEDVLRDQSAETSRRFAEGAVKGDLTASLREIEQSMARAGLPTLRQEQKAQIAALLQSRIAAGDLLTFLGKVSALKTAADRVELASQVTRLMLDTILDGYDLVLAGARVHDGLILDRVLDQRENGLRNRLAALKKDADANHCPWSPYIEDQWRIASGVGLPSGSELTRMTERVESLLFAVESETTQCAASRGHPAPSAAAVAALGGLVGAVGGAAISGSTRGILIGMGTGAAIGSGVGAALKARSARTKTLTPVEMAVCSHLTGERARIDEALAGLTSGSPCVMQDYTATMSCVYQQRDVLPTLELTLRQILDLNRKTCGEIDRTLHSPPKSHQHAGLFPDIKAVRSCAAL